MLPHSQFELVERTGIGIGDARVVDEAIEPVVAEPLLDPDETARHFAFLADIAGEQQRLFARQRVAQFGQRFGIGIEPDDAPAEAVKVQGDGAADAVARAGNENGLHGSATLPRRIGAGGQAYPSASSTSSSRAGSPSAITVPSLSASSGLPCQSDMVPPAPSTIGTSAA